MKARTSLTEIKITVYIPWSGSIKFKIVKMPILPKLISILQCNPYQNSSRHFWRNCQVILEYIWKCNWYRMAKTILKRYCKATIIKYCPKDRQIYQCNRTENPEIDPHIWSQLIFDQGAKSLQWEKGSLFKHVAATNGFSCGQKRNFISFSLHTQN